MDDVPYIAPDAAGIRYQYGCGLYPVPYKLQYFACEYHGDGRPSYWNASCALPHRINNPQTTTHPRDSLANEKVTVAERRVCVSD